MKRFFLTNIFGFYIILTSSAQITLSPQQLRIEATFKHISVKYDITGDDNRNSIMTVKYREAGHDSWLSSAPVIRAWPELIVGNAPLESNYHACSVMFLEPDTEYELEILLDDPDGGSTAVTEFVRTKSYQTEGITYKYIIPEPDSTNTGIEPDSSWIPSNSLGTGDIDDPFIGLQVAADSAQPGWTFLIADGIYEPFSIQVDGEYNEPITFKAQNTHRVIVEGSSIIDETDFLILVGTNDNPAENIIIDGLTIKNGINGIKIRNTKNLDIKNCYIENVVNGIICWQYEQAPSDIYITNNIIKGRFPWPAAAEDDSGIGLKGTNHVISHNYITCFTNGITTEGSELRTSFGLDIYNKDN